MSTWKVILATLVIFVAGLFTGALLVSRVQHSNPLQPNPARPFMAGPLIFPRDLLPRMERELELSSPQIERIDTILKESRERTAILWKLLEPEWREELRVVTGLIRDELRPEQRGRFEELLKRPRRASELQPVEGPRPLSPDDPRRLPPNRPRFSPAPPNPAQP